MNNKIAEVMFGWTWVTAPKGLVLQSNAIDWLNKKILVPPKFKFPNVPETGYNVLAIDVPNYEEDYRIVLEKILKDHGQLGIDLISWDKKVGRAVCEAALQLYS